MAELKKTKGTPTGLVAEKDEKPKRELPRVSFTVEALPSIKDWKVGGKYRLELEVEQVAAEKDRYGYEEGKDKPLTATFKVTAVKAANKNESGGNPEPKKPRRNPNAIGY